VSNRFFISITESSHYRLLMRPKFILSIVLPALLIMSVVVLLRQSKPQAKSQIVTAPAAPVAPPVYIAPPAPAPVAVKIPTPEERQAAIDAEKDRLYDWSMSGDPANLPKILADLNSPEKEIRLIAIEATKQFNDTNAIPVLTADAAKADAAARRQAYMQARTQQQAGQPPNQPSAPAPSQPAGN
jgi:hypothetical protein